MSFPFNNVTRDIIAARLDELRQSTGLPAVLLDERVIRAGDGR